MTVCRRTRRSAAMRSRTSAREDGSAATSAGRRRGGRARGNERRARDGPSRSRGCWRRSRRRERRAQAGVEVRRRRRRLTVRGDGNVCRSVNSCADPKRMWSGIKSTVTRRTAGKAVRKRTVKREGSSVIIGCVRHHRHRRVHRRRVHRRRVHRRRRVRRRRARRRRVRHRRARRRALDSRWTCSSGTRWTPSTDSRTISW